MPWILYFVQRAREMSWCIVTHSACPTTIPQTARTLFFDSRWAYFHVWDEQWHEFASFFLHFCLYYSMKRIFTEYRNHFNQINKKNLLFALSIVWWFQLKRTHVLRMYVLFKSKSIFFFFCKICVVFSFMRTKWCATCVFFCIVSF